MHAGFFRDLESDGPVLSLHDDHAFLPLDVDPAIRGKHRGGLNGGPEDLAVNEAGLWHAALDRDRKFFFSSRRRHTKFDCDWSSDVCSSDLMIRHTRFDCDWSSDVCSSD